MKNMLKVTRFTLILLLLFFNSCKEKTINRASYIPNQYEFPTLEIGNGKSFYYQRLGFIEGGFVTKLEYITEKNSKYIVKSNFDYKYGTLLDSVKLTDNYNILEIYNYYLLDRFSIKKVKAKIIKAKIIDDGSKYGKRISTLEYNHNSRKLIIHEKQRYLYDTIINDYGSNRNCLVTETLKNLIYYTNKKEIANEKIKEVSYYVKGRGLCILKTFSKDDDAIFMQVNIKNSNGSYYKLEK